MNIFEQKKNFSLGKIYSDGDIFQKSELQETYEWSRDVITKSFKNCIFLELDNPNMKYLCKNVNFLQHKTFYI